MGSFENARYWLSFEDRITCTIRKHSDIPNECSADNSGSLAASGNPLVGLSAPCKKPKAGRPSTSRDNTRI